MRRTECADEQRMSQTAGFIVHRDASLCDARMREMQRQEKFALLEGLPNHFHSLQTSTSKVVEILRSASS